MDKKKLLIIIISVVATLAVAGTALGIGLSLGGSDSSSESSQSSTDSSESSYFDPSFTVSFESNEGTAFQPIEVDNGSFVDLSQYMPEKENSFFYGWCEDPSFEVRVPVQYYPTSDITLYAEWGVEETFTIKFDTGAGSRIPDASYTTYQYLVKPEDPTRKGYAFGGWYQDEEWTKEFIFFGNTMPRRNIRIYAKWIKLYSITFDTNGGSNIEAIYGFEGDKYSIPANPTKHGQIFDGWYSNSSLTKPYTMSGMINKEEITIYAKWRSLVTDIKVNFNVNNSVVSLQPEQLTFDEGDTLNAQEIEKAFSDAVANYYAPYIYNKDIVATEKPVYQFSGWAYDKQGKNLFEGRIPKIDGTSPSITLYAIWARSSFYKMVEFNGLNTETKFYVENNTVFDTTEIENTFGENIELNGWVLDGFYTEGGQFYKSGEKITSDMELYPYYYSRDLVIEFDESINGYEVVGYKADSDTANAETLKLYIPKYFNDGTHGALSVRKIGEDAFSGKNIVSVEMPETITTIGSNAFSSCAKLTAITIPSSVKTLGNNVFANTGLDSFGFAGELTKLGVTVFEGSPYGDALKKENGYVFFDDAKTVVYKYTGSEENIVIPSTIKMVASEAFRQVDAKSLTISDSVVRLGDRVFFNSKLENVVVGNSVRDLGESAFESSNVKTLTFKTNRNLNFISKSAFKDCQMLEAVDLTTLPYLEKIEEYAFWNCINLKEVLLSQGVEVANGLISYFGEIGANAFAKSSIEELILPFSTTKLGDYAFSNCAKLKTMPTSSSLVEIGEYCFENCTAITNVDLRGERLIEEDYRNEEDEWIEVYSEVPVAVISEGAFYGCSSLEYFFLSFDAVSVESKAFANCTALKRIIAFGELNNDEPVKFNEEAFFGLSTLPDFYVQEGRPDYSATSKWKTASGMMTYVEIYTISFEGTIFENATIKVVDKTPPVIEFTNKILEPEASANLTAFDVLAFIKANISSITDNVSAPENCEVSIVKVIRSDVEEVDDEEENLELVAVDGKYDISTPGKYDVTVRVTDEFGSFDEKIIQISVKA